MEEFIKYIKWLGMLIYKNELDKLQENNVNFIFFDDIKSIIYQKENSDNVFIIYNDNIEDATKKLYKYIIELKKQFEIMDISVFKGNDNKSFSGTFFISVYCVELKKYAKNIDKYNNVFSSSINNVNSIFEKVFTIIEEEKTNRIAMNEIPQNDENIKINNLFYDMLNNFNKYQDMNLDKLRQNFINYKKDEPKYFSKSEEIEKNILESAKIKYIDDYLQKYSEIKNRKKITINHLVNKKFKRKSNDIYKCNYNRVIVVDYEKDIELSHAIEIINNRNLADLIIIKSNNKIKYNNVPNIYITSHLIEIIELNKKIKILYISNKQPIVKAKNIINVRIDNISEITEQEFMYKIIESDIQLAAFANLDNVNSIKVLTSTFFNYDGDNYCAGGAERYLIDLHKICKKIGYKLRIYQKANYNFLKLYGNIEIVGLTSKNENYNFKYEQDMEILKQYFNFAKDTTKLNIFSSFIECHGKSINPSIGISHGVAWDNKLNKYDRNNMNDKAWIIDSAKACDKIISVDTNTANFFQTVDYELGNSTEVIQNYVDPDEFKPDCKKENSKIIILYPRRLHESRGMYLLLNITDKLMRKFNNIEIHFVGKGLKEDTNSIQKKIDKWGNDKIKIYNCSPEKMNEVYKVADISVIPTLYSEGTSLSCLEAMSSENAVIATRIGGLTELIINKYNGILIEPNSESLYNAVVEYIENPDLMNKCKKNAREIAKSFNKDIWIKKWKKIIKQYALKKDEISKIKYEIIKIYTNKNKINCYNLNKLILENLLNNKIVYIITDVTIKEKSYERLQYVSSKSEFYKKADYVFVDKEYEGKVLENEYKNIEL